MAEDDPYPSDVDPDDPYDQELVDSVASDVSDDDWQAIESEHESWLMLGRALAAARTRKKLSKRAAAGAAGFSEGLWRHLEDGRRLIYGQWVYPNPRDENLIAAANAVDLDPREVFMIVDRRWPGDGPDLRPVGLLPAALSGKLNELTPEQLAKLEAYVDGLIDGER